MTYRKIIDKVRRYYREREDKIKLDKYLKVHGSTHACPNCNMWEHEGNTIYTEIYDSQTDKRTCENCNHVWRSLFCPAGHVHIEGYEWKDEKFVRSNEECKLM